MEYQVIFEINGKREVLVLEHVKEEYGVSVQEFWCCWPISAKYNNGEGKCAEEAISDMLSQMQEREEFRKQFKAAIDQSTASFKTPIIKEFEDVMVSAYVNQARQVRRLING